MKLCSKILSFVCIISSTTAIIALEEITFAMIKPDAVAAGQAQKIMTLIKDKDLKIIAQKKLRLTPKQINRFYAEHKNKPWFKTELVPFVTEGPVVIMALQGENAIQAWRNLMGKTNPAEADEDTIRKKFGTSKLRNAVHGSDSPESAQRELTIFFPQLVNGVKVKELKGFYESLNE